MQAISQTRYYIPKRKLDFLNRLQTTNELQQQPCFLPLRDPGVAYRDELKEIVADAFGFRQKFRQASTVVQQLFPTSAPLAAPLYVLTPIHDLLYILTNCQDSIEIVLYGVQSSRQVIIMAAINTRRALDFLCQLATLSGLAGLYVSVRSLHAQIRADEETARQGVLFIHCEYFR